MTSTSSVSPRGLSRRSSRGRVVAAGIVAALGMALVPAVSAEATAGLGVTSTSTQTAAPNQTTSLTGMAVTGGADFDSVKVTVSTDLGTVGIGNTTGVTLAFGNHWSGDQATTFSGSPIAVNNALASATLTVGSSLGETAHVTLTAFVESADKVYSPSNGHFYEYVSASGITWTAARTAAAARTFNGQVGYLATIPTSTVNDLVSSRIPGATAVWFGAIATNTPNDSVARTWSWADGPLAGDTITECSNFTGACTKVNDTGRFSSWADNEPNNAGGTFSDGQYDVGSGEWVAVTNYSGSPGRWNDQKPTNTSGVSGYVVEYGDLPTGSSDSAGVVSDTSSVAIVATPGAPTDVATTRGNGEVTVTYGAAAANGSPITGYTVVAEPGPITCTSTTTSCTVGDLVNGTEYSFTVYATNANGNGPASQAVTGTPSTVPGAPTAVTAQRGDRSATVSFEAPEDFGGAPSRGYAITARPGDLTFPCSASPCVVGDLTNGEEYTFTVQAMNVAGYSAESEESNAVVPAGVPTEPGNVEATRGNGTAEVSFTASDGNGAAVIGYTVTSFPGGLVCTAASTTSCEVSGLTNGTAYTFTVTATNDVGDSLPSDASNSVTPATVPTAPRDLTVTRDDESVQVGFSAPTSDGGSAVIGYEYTLDGGESWSALETSGTSALTATIPNLANGTSYEVAVRARNAVGVSDSSSSAEGTPARRPGAPTDVTAVRGDQQASVAFLAPADNGSAITGYTVTSAPGGFTATCPGSPCVVTGLSNGTPYTFTVVATNDVGDSEPSSSTDSVTPATTPAAPRHVDADSHDTAVSLTFDAPLDDGGAEVTAYQASLDGGETWQALTVTAGDGLIASISDLVNGSEVEVIVRAVNAVGPGEASSPGATATPAGVPSAPREITRSVTGTSAVVGWAAPTDDGGRPVVGYDVTASPGEGTCSTTGATSCTVEGLTVGESYVFTVTASNLTEGYHGTGSGPGADSAPVTMTAVPGVTTDLSGVGGDRTLHLAWQPPVNEGTTPVIGYEVSIDGGDTWSPVETTGSDPVRTVVERVLNGTTYEVSVRAVNGDGAGEAGAVVEVTPQTWFEDPLTTEQRARLIDVPRHPERYRGPARRTTAMATAHDGTVAMAADTLDRRRMQPGQAVDFGWGPLFEFNRAVLSQHGRGELRAMVRSLRWVDAVTCEGYADYGGKDVHARRLARSRARVVCEALQAYGAPVDITVRSYGNDMPVVVSGTRHPDRAPNRRVVVRVDR